MNTLGNGIVDRLRVLAINRAKGTPQGNREEIIELKEEFRDLINNPIFPLGTNSAQTGGGTRLLSSLVRRNPQNPQ